MPFSSTMLSIPPPALPFRLWQSVRRLAAFPIRLIANDVILIFASGGMGLLEKGAMCLLARLLRRGVVLRISSGELPGKCKKYPFLRLWLQIMLRCAHVVCSQGPFWTGYFGSYPEAAGKILEIPNGIRLPVAAQVRRPDAIRNRQASIVRITFVGWMQREKGIFDALDAFREILRIVPQAVFTLAGGGQDEEEFKRAAADLGPSVEIRGWLSGSEIQSLLFDTDVFLLPTHFEGMPNALLEAMASAAPVVTTPVGSIPDLIINGENGLLVGVRDTAAITDAVLHLINDPERAHSIALAAQKTVQERYDIERIWRLYAEGLARAAAAVGRTRMIPEMG